MKIGFICPQVPGHLNPLTALARHLQMRGHEVVFLYSSGAAGLPLHYDFMRAAALIAGSSLSDLLIGRVVRSRGSIEVDCRDCLGGGE